MGKKHSKVTAEGRFDGVGTIPGGSYDRLSIDGVVTFSTDVQATAVDVDGVATFNGNLQADQLETDGVVTIRGDATAQQLDCDGVTTIDGNLRMGKAVIRGVVKVKRGKVEADEINCDGVLQANCEISADRICADGMIFAREIVGDQIEINSRKHNIAYRIISKISDALVYGKFSQIDVIEATTVKLYGVQATQVNGHDVHIGENCRIDCVDCSGTLFIAPSAEVGKVVGQVQEN